MPKIEDLLNKLIYPLLVAFLTPLLASLGSYFITGDVLNWFSRIPDWGWNAFVGFIGVWIIIVLIRNRLESIKPSGVRATTISRYGYEEIGEIDYEGVKWKVIAPLPHPSSFNRSPDLTPSRIRVSIPPRCPECGTKLEESKSFWGGYNWECVGCGFKKRSRESYYTIDDRVEKLAQRDVEKRYFENP
ncbi:MAG: hypothetical protein ACFFDT_21505 [Candidatus Hodarchaeota archaeon]